MRKLFVRICVPALAAAALAGCASVAASHAGDAQRQADYAAAAGVPVSSFRFYEPLWSWDALGTQQVVVYTRPDQAWLLDLDACPNLPYANAIAVTSRLHEVVASFDRVLAGGHFPPCQILRIRPVDLARFKHERQRQRPVGEPPRDVPATQ